MFSGEIIFNSILPIETIEDNIVVTEGKNKIDLLTKIYIKLKSRTFYAKGQSELVKLFGIKEDKLIKIKELILSDTYGDDFDPKIHKKFLEDTLLELNEKYDDNRVFGSNCQLKTFFVTSFNVKLLAQNLKIKHISCKSLLLYMYESKLHETLELRNFTCDRINKMIENNFIFQKKQEPIIEEKQNLEKSGVQDVFDNWKEHEADCCEVMEALFDPTVDLLEDGFFEEVLKFHTRPSQDNPPLKKTKL